MDLNIATWQEYRLGDLFDIKKGKRLTSEEQTDGTTPYIGAIDSNNGVANYIGQEPIHQGNTISLSYNGSVGEAFYQPVPFWATDDVNVLYFKQENGVEFNKYIALFICALLKREKYRYCYGRKWVLESMRETMIKLPTINNSPDWNWMENYIKSLKYKPITTSNVKQDSQIDVSTWKDYKLGSLFDNIYKAEAHIKAEFEIFDSPTENSIKFISRTETNNGCDCYIVNNDLSGVEDGQAIVIGDTTATCSYQNDSFVCGDHIVICRGDWINVYTGLFVVALIKREKYKYNYGRAFNMSLISNTLIKLPSTPHGDPDWVWIEKYIKSLPFSDKI